MTKTLAGKFFALLEAVCVFMAFLAVLTSNFEVAVTLIMIFCPLLVFVHFLYVVVDYLVSDRWM